MLPPPDTLPESEALLDLFIIGGGINGCGIARDAAGRGHSVALAEMNDLASATSAASTKLFHGGLRYLEFFEFRLVREALKEREVLLEAMPHIARPMRFVLPLYRGMRFEADTPASGLLSFFMPWMKGRRPDWLIRAGLFLYDNMGKRRHLRATTTLDLTRDPAGAPLKSTFRKAFEYSDCTVDDSRLVVLNARDAANRGAQIMTHTKVTGAERSADHWVITTKAADGTLATHRARCLVNAAGPWVSETLRDVLGIASPDSIRLVRGSHILTRRLYDHDRAYFLQGDDGRIIFVIPYETDFTMIGTTEAPHDDPDNTPVCTPAEQQYLLDFVSQYFKRQLSAADVVSSFSGVRPLYDDGAQSATAATRDYVLKLDQAGGGAPLLSVFGGKITTYRKLAEAALEKIEPTLGAQRPHWTAGAPLPGGDFAVEGGRALADDLVGAHPFLDAAWAMRLVRAYGTDAALIFKRTHTAADAGPDFGATITARELEWAVEHEWVTSADDFLWRRSKLGLRLSRQQAEAIEAHIQALRKKEPNRTEAAFT